MLLNRLFLCTCQLLINTFMYDTLQQGGFLLLEATSATMFAGCCKSYYNRILDLWHSGSSPGRVVPQYSEDKTVLDVRSSLNSQQLQHVTQDHLQEFSLNISHLFLIFVSNDESGNIFCCCYKFSNSN